MIEDYHVSLQRYYGVPVGADINSLLCALVDFC